MAAPSDSSTASLAEVGPAGTAPLGTVPVGTVPVGTVPPGTVPPADGNRWISLLDSEGDLWLFDATFLLSNHHCIFGQGCPSIDLEPDHTETLGCCIHGAHLADDDDLAKVSSYAALLDDSNWQFRARATRKGGPFKKNRDGDWVTRKVDDACIFLNRSGFEGGGGCALHRAALERGERPLDWKPDVCWQVPIRLDVHSDEFGRDTVFVKGWGRKDWGDGGQDFHWWCTEEIEAFSADVPVFEGSRDELMEMIGEDLYRRLATELHAIRAETPVTILESR